jgi:hypothetical protein
MEIRVHAQRDDAQPRGETAAPFVLCDSRRALAFLKKGTLPHELRDLVDGTRAPLDARER